MSSLRTASTTLMKVLTRISRLILGTRRLPLKIRKSLSNNQTPLSLNFPTSPPKIRVEIFSKIRLLPAQLLFKERKTSNNGYCCSLTRSQRTNLCAKNRKVLFMSQARTNTVSTMMRLITINSMTLSRKRYPTGLQTAT